MNFKRIAVICILCLLLCGCEDSICDCKVVDKKYRPGYTTMVPIYNGKSVMLIPQYHPETWYLIIEGENKDGEICRRTIQVDQVEYHNSVIGQEWSK